VTTGSSSKHARRPLFSSATLSQIVDLVEQGRSPREIAAVVGCTLGTLRVKCSQAGISLRRYPAAVSERRSLVIVNIKLSREDAQELRRQGQKKGLPETKLASMLIETVVEDDLYHAVLDREQVAPDSTRRRISSRRSPRT
jgi:hypothetical protein